MKNRIYKETFKDSTLSSAGEYIDGKKTGEWKYYLRNGRLKAIGRFPSGKMIGEWIVSSLLPSSSGGRSRHIAARESKVGFNSCWMESLGS